jgi:acyl-CoA reductase-like NAD-dependent aldehyde dehydrogenase
MHMDQQTVRKTFKEKRRPTPAQERALEAVLWRCRELYNAALARMRADDLGKTHAILINNQDVVAGHTYENQSPIDHNWLLAHLQAGTRQHAEAAVAAARAAFPAWSATDWRERVRLVRHVADLIESRLYEMGVATVVNVGKTRMESLADAQEAVELLRSPCDYYILSYLHEQSQTPVERNPPVAGA